ncbi:MULTISPECIES: TetR/AcrR family transcriptional regulator [Rhizobium/Agrobacterium group]|uniref:TetR/AcrR family transcriptional regulator n=1 Tax=Rhizobium/Agrobacterium group TaxID=227290 RepID=UPI001ADB830A|nr:MULTISPECIES: TetR/AcrR family transcriptional regulator [Rhizobium/Agrobacterium group]MBO9112528.1 TetR/AcrR family transcriptional regulator [Agrobacterium sp. S2/73]QXZ76034.1 TetR/AcrR family transcriptional regulator [Agrobacterium sp. S7/73]QYA16955.1 TetR/AcrR family transcriptional regulator [Rhizobium sp. AB2/73]UEQ85472.1 TetR/AcrR family transcriptional regulator [Rhizobium sp. AB2/73]
MVRPQEFNTADVLHRALSVFWSKGYEAASLVDLVEATGLSRSSLYGSFGGKHALFLAAFDSYRADRARAMDLTLDNGLGRAAIETFFRSIIEDSRAPHFSNGCMSTNQAVELAPHDPAVRQRIEFDFQLIEDALERTIARGKVDGSIATVASARTLARLFVVAFPGFQVLVRAGGSEDRLSAALKQLLATLDL